jgi:hypothetical protein
MTANQPSDRPTLIFRLTLKDNETGYSRTFDESRQMLPDETSELEAEDNFTFLWEEGNYSCDCNRSIFLWPHDDSKHLECSDNRIELVSLERIS